MNLKGYFTLEKYLLGVKVGDEMEKRLGYDKGCLSNGAELYGFDPNDFRTWIKKDQFGKDVYAYHFELRGYTTWPGGVPVLGSRPTNLDEDVLKKLLCDDVFKKTAPARPVKIRPLKTGCSYPMGKGIPQWELVKDVPAFLIKILRYNDIYR